MRNSRFPEPYPASDWLDAGDDTVLQERLGLYQVFLRLYEQHRGLLDEVLSLEHSSGRAFGCVSFSYVQGVLAAGSVYLVTNLVQETTQVLHQPQQTWTMGRDPQTVSIALPDPKLSRCHAAIRYVADRGFYLLDLHSTNGTFVNGERVWQATPLRDGDRVRLGSLSFIFFVCQQVKALNPISVEQLARIDNLLTKAPSPTASATKLLPATVQDEIPRHVLEETLTIEHLERSALKTPPTLDN